MLCIGHRGAAGYEPENTLRSFERAIQLGAPWIELDVYHVDGQLVVIHDDRLERTTDGQGYVAGQSFDYLRSLDAGKGEKIPTLAEVFALVNGRAGINIELKGKGTAAPVMALVAQQFAAGWSREKIMLSSFHHPELQAAKKIDPEIRIGALLVGLLLDKAAYGTALNAYSVNLSLDFVDQSIVDDAHARGLKVFVFTVNHPDDIARMAALGVDGVFSDYPDRVLQAASAC